MQPLDHELSAAVLAITSELFPSGFDVAASAPETFETLCEHVERSGRFLIYSGASDATIWGAPEVNHAFRAWHDYHHYHSRLPFTPEGEFAAFIMQANDLIKRYGATAKTHKWIAILDAEINGQLAYAARHNGEFPVDQRAFVRCYLDDARGACTADF